ncbi:hypothetical protein AAVH_23523 [Aphelenchoides avenae]|nr:hypothetical protein AAVH_23523 [Aphelenchus avenae]
MPRDFFLIFTFLLTFGTATGQWYTGNSYSGPYGYGYGNPYYNQYSSYNSGGYGQRALYPVLAPGNGYNNRWGGLGVRWVLGRR